MTMTTIDRQERAAPGAFGRRKVSPRACIIDGKPHLRAFLADALDELRFVTSECSGVDELAAVVGEQQPDILVIGSSIGGVEAARILDVACDAGFDGSVMLISARETIALRAILHHGLERHLTMLPPLATPFSAQMLRESIAPLLPQEPAPKPEVDVAEALKTGWLELWYQRKLDARSLTPCGAEALVRLRHPNWGVVVPSAFLPDHNDPHFRALSEFVVERAVADWRYLLAHHGPVDLSINLPARFLLDAQAVDDLCAWVPTHPAFGGLIVEIDAHEIAAHLDAMVDVARRLRLRNIAIAVDKVGADWPELMHRDTFPFVELKVDRTYVTGCADDRLKRAVCRRIVDLAGDYGARCTATGIESRADYIAAHELGFDLVQGYLFGKPMGLKKFARAAIGKPLSTLA
ncbi:EAL domain-containing protein [Rhodopseudomonas pseudopalustris]|uniref:Response regulator receiver modulated diguanylate phosphodiesterase n=1 Tax=Rhodopseudomonas pseudopalustris TaxID=1513892 RepID=A0A1H8LM91_9BRAD|nr:EAL domain-containing protein [Rhodopseudomonas pseudopalustris]MBB1092314.1 EAL domain-containing protein [Rhodopseudomonas palustris]SEO06217.1 response regulator receiver modulated diguanylate phosphodiesterase [Rhodopseudomonas pseudopalustris]